MIRRSILLTCVCAGAISCASGQVNPDQANRANLLKEHYQNAVNSDLRFVNGSLYQDTYPGANGHPFLGSGSWSEGTVFSKEEKFEGLLLKYDLVGDFLIYNHIHQTGIYAINLNKDLIDGFELQGHRFQHIKTTTSSFQEGKMSEIVEPGFYEEIIRGSISLFIKRSKQYEPPSTAGTGRFIPVQHIFILKGETLFRIKGKRGLIRVLQDQEKPLKRYIREHGIILRGDNPAGYRQLVEYYNSIQP